PHIPMPWDKGGPLGEGQTFALSAKKAERTAIEAAKAAGLLDVDLGDEWAPFIFSEADAGGEPKPNFYRPTFIALANNRTTPDELFFESPEGQRAVLAAANVPPRKKKDPVTPEEKHALDAAQRVLRGERGRNFLEVYGIPPTVGVLRARLEADKGRACYGQVDLPALAAFSGTVSYLTRERAKREFDQAQADAVWAGKILASPDGGILPTSTVPPAPGAAAPSAPPSPLADPKVAARLERYRQGQARLKAVHAVQARLVCEGLLNQARITEGMFDLATHEALADWERKNDIFGWGFLGGETLEALQKPPLALHFETWKRLLMERLADAAGILEDGSAGKGKKPLTYKDEAGAEHPIPDLIGEHLNALLKAMHVETPDELAAFLDALGPEGTKNLHVAIPPPPLPPYYSPDMDLSAEIDRGDVWYDFPWDAKGKPVEQRRAHYPSFTIFVTWQKQKIPLCRWRTTIGSWRSELHPDGKVYYKYKNSDIGPRIWKNIVAAPVWIPPEITPSKDLLTRKVFDRNVGPVSVVNTDVMGPGFQSAYGLVMAIHLKEQPGGGLFDNQIRTHGSVDYTSIARRFSHGCHRLVNNRAVRLYDFVLRHRTFTRQGNVPLGHMKKVFTVEDKEYEYELNTRGYYYELTPPVPVNVTEGRVMGKVKKPITDYVRKPGVDYGDSESEGEGTPVENLGNP
ncbi:MAG TPA: L,D-transpeptidase, partial [Polyangia bacterium]|nr:L,D-transpeptidase [Polyangia bacterium]